MPQQFLLLKKWSKNTLFVAVIHIENVMERQIDTRCRPHVLDLPEANTYILRELSSSYARIFFLPYNNHCSFSTNLLLQNVYLPHDLHVAQRSLYIYIIWFATFHQPKTIPDYGYVKCKICKICSVTLKQNVSVARRLCDK